MQKSSAPILTAAKVPKLVQDFVNRLKLRRARFGPAAIQTTFLGARLLVKTREDVGRSIIIGQFELNDLDFFLTSIEEDDVIFDIGANVGAYCIPIAFNRPKASIFAFEPIPLNAAMIKVSSFINDLKNIRLIEQCVSDRSGSVHFSVAEDSAYSSMIDTGRKPEVNRLQVSATSLDEFAAENNIEQVNLMKIDVEGAELKVLQGATRLFSGLSSRPRLVLIELYDKNLRPFGTSIGDVVAQMASWGYRPFILIGRERVDFAAKHHNRHYNVFFELTDR